MAGKIITIAQQKGGAGKTTVAAHLAVAWQKAGHSVGLIDTDPQGSLSMWFDQRKQPDGAPDVRFAKTEGWRVESEASRMARECDWVVIDSPPHAETASKVAVRAADLVVLPVQPSPTDLWATQATLTIAEKERVKALLVMNRVPTRGKLLDRIRAKMEGDNLPIAETTLGNRQAYAASMMEGMGVVEHRNWKTAAAEIQALTAELEALLA